MLQYHNSQSKGVITQSHERALVYTHRSVLLTPLKHMVFFMLACPQPANKPLQGSILHTPPLRRIGRDRYNVFGQIIGLDKVSKDLAGLGFRALQLKVSQSFGLLGLEWPVYLR